MKERARAHAGRADLSGAGDAARRWSPPASRRARRTSCGARWRRGRRKGGLEPFEQRADRRHAEHGYSAKFAEQIYRQILGFGEYGFPESHSASFALLVYVSSWLKCHEPAAFTCALLNSQPMGFYAPVAAGAGRAAPRRRGAAVDVMVSDWDCTLELPARPANRRCAWVCAW